MRDDGLIDYELPEDLIAQVPAPERSQSRLLVLDRRSGSVAHDRFGAIATRLRSGDLLVINDTRVIAARLRAHRPTGGAAEILLVEPTGAGDGTWCVLLRPGKAGRAGRELLLDGDRAVLVRAVGRDGGAFVVRFEQGGRGLDPADVVELAERIGETPLPPYIRRASDGATDGASDRERYQTVWARRPGAVAAPTAGLHFTKELIAELDARGVETVAVTLHVGLDTFKPLSADQLERGELHGERVEIEEDAGARILAAEGEGRRIIAVGTTSVRALESFAASRELPFRTRTRLFIRPGYEFRLVSGLITNFHLPRSSLLLLVAAFAGERAVLAAYAEAIAARYRFFSYGDAMLIS